MLEFYFRFRFWPYCHRRYVIRHQPTNFYLNWTIGDGIVTSTSGFQFGHGSHSRKSKTICTPNFDKIFQLTADVLLLPVSENKPPPYRNATSGFHFDDFIVIGLWFCVGLPNFIRIRRSATDIWCIDCPRWRPRRRKYTSSFRFGDVNQLQIETLKTIYTPNFAQIAQSAAELLLLSVSENKRPPYWNYIFSFHFDDSIVIGMWLCVGIPNFVQIGPSTAELWRCSHFQDGGHQPCWICYG